MRVYVIDLAGWGLVGAAAGAGAYAIKLFGTKVSAGVAKAILLALL